MKKLIVCVLLAFACCLFVCACGSGTTDNPDGEKDKTELTEKNGGMDDAVAAEIRLAYYNIYKEHFVSEYYTYTKDDISFRYYGEYNGAYVAFIDVPFFGHDCAIHQYSVDGVTIVYSDGQTLDVYYQGSFYSLFKAFENGLLTHTDLEDIQTKHFENYPFLSEEMNTFD